MSQGWRSLGSAAGLEQFVRFEAAFLGRQPEGLLVCTGLLSDRTSPHGHRLVPTTIMAAARFADTVAVHPFRRVRQEGSYGHSQGHCDIGR